LRKTTPGKSTIFVLNIEENVLTIEENVLTIEEIVLNIEEIVLTIEEIVLIIEEIVLNIEDIFLSTNESIVDVRCVISSVIRELRAPARISRSSALPSTPAGTRNTDPLQVSPFHREITALARF
jgi:hypothetical protein